jgi:hypothetical protein
MRCIRAAEIRTLLVESQGQEKAREEGQVRKEVKMIWQSFGQASVGILWRGTKQPDL